MKKGAEKKVVALKLAEVRDVAFIGAGEEAECHDADMGVYPRLWLRHLAGPTITDSVR